MTVTLVQIVFLIASLALCALILLQQTKGSGMGALGGGASSTVFGARGASSFLYKTTRFLAGVFFVGALLLGYLQNKESHHSNILEQQTQLEVTKSDAVLDIPVVSKDNAPPASSTDVPAPTNK
ncbi:MAG: preprotein translocase subunit SecG [Cardiobacteriaceae bacterium]|nr:preprotein translocase subunit SecG [Cardiobacteriaceae bacterium]